MSEILGPMMYQLDLPGMWKIHNAFHGAVLSPYQETKEYGKNFTEPLPELIKGEPKYEVERILGSRQQGQGHALQFLVQWKGYSLAHNSWEPQANIHAQKLIKEFYKEEPMAIRRVIIDDKEADDPSATMDSFSSSTPSLHYPSSINLEGPLTVDPAVLIPDFSQVVYDNSPNHSPLPTSMLTPKVPTTMPGSIHCAAMSENTEVNMDLPVIPDVIHPGPPWFHTTDMIRHPLFQVTIGDKLVTLPYL